MLWNFRFKGVHGVEIAVLDAANIVQAEGGDGCYDPLTFTCGQIGEDREERATEIRRPAVRELRSSGLDVT